MCISRFRYFSPAGTPSPSSMTCWAVTQCFDPSRSTSSSLSTPWCQLHSSNRYNYNIIVEAGRFVCVKVLCGHATELFGKLVNILTRCSNNPQIPWRWLGTVSLYFLCWGEGSGGGGGVDLLSVELVSKDDEIIFKGEAYSYFCDWNYNPLRGLICCQKMYNNSHIHISSEHIGKKVILESFNSLWKAPSLHVYMYVLLYTLEPGTLW